MKRLVCQTKITKSVIFLVVSCLFYSCSSKKQYSVVFCDFTSSIDSVNSVTKIKNDAVGILFNDAEDSQIELYSINKNYNSHCLFRSTPLKNNPKPSERDAFDKDLKTRKDSLIKILDKASSSISLNRNEPNSCIIECIEKAITYFKSYPDYKKASLRLYLLSDMLECCSGYGKPTICIENNSNINKAIELTDSIKNLQHTFKDLPNLKVYIILASNQENHTSYINFRKFWEPVFKKFGYDSFPYHKPVLPFAF